MSENILNIENYRILSQIFTPSIVRNIVRENAISPFNKKIKNHLKTDKKLTTNFQILSELYSLLEKDYRCEYIYKNQIFQNIISEYSLENSSIFSEFKVGSSIADLIFLNGSIRIYEIKTELDTLTKLEKQIEDYFKVANKVHIVTDENYSEKILDKYNNSNVGILKFTPEFDLCIVKEAVEKNDGFDFEALFKLLRKQEYLDLVNLNFGFIPNVPNTQIFKISFNLLKEIDIVLFQKQVLNILKQRKLERPDLLLSDKTPSELKLICNTLNFDEDEYEQLFNFLNKQNLCISHI